MKTTTTFFIFLFISFFSFAQDSLKIKDNFFFKTEFDSLGECYGKCLIQAQFDTLEREIIIYPERKKYTKIGKHYEYDTVKLDCYYLYRGNLNQIINLVDTSTQMILIREEKRRLVGCTKKEIDDCRETVTEQYLEFPSYKKWDLANYKNMYYSNAWELNNTKEIYKTRTKRVIKMPDCCGTREEMIPSEYLTAIVVKPKENITDIELDSIKLFCKNYYIHKTIKPTLKEEVVPAKIKEKTEIKLVSLAKTTYKKILCTTTTTICQLQKQLYVLGFYSGSFQGEFNNETKTAIIKYQVKNNLPIGQLDEETVKHILSRQTPFYKTLN